MVLRRFLTIWDIGFGISGFLASFKTVGEEVLPLLPLKTLYQSVPGQLIDALALGRRLRLQLGERFFRDVNLDGSHGCALLFSVPYRGIHPPWPIRCCVLS